MGNERGTMGMKMTPIKLAAFCAIMDHHRAGFEHAHPEYLMEKFHSLARGDDYYAVQMLDGSNKARLDQWHDNFKEWLKKHECGTDLDKA
jgi:hypothetical protein